MLFAHVVDQPIEGRASTAVRQAEGHRDGRQHERRIGDRGQLHEVDPVGEGAEGSPRDLEAETRLPRAARPQQGHQAAVREQFGNLGDLALAAEERRQAGGQVIANRIQRPDGRKVVPKPSDHELPDPLGLLDVLEPMVAKVPQLDALGQPAQ